MIPPGGNSANGPVSSTIAIKTSTWLKPSVYFDSHQNIPASHLGIPGGIENLDLQY